MPSTQGKQFFGHPIGLSTLFFTELWERFGYYGMRALLILYLASSVESGGFGMDVATAYSIYGLYTGMVYLVSLPGGWIADRILGQQRAVLYGGILIAAGYLMLAVPSPAVFYAGLAVVVAGTGLLKPNVSAIVGQIYSPDDPRRDSGFSIFYMGINIGAMVAPLVCGYLGQRVNWQLGFAAAGVGMILGVLTFLRGLSRLGSAGLHPVTHENPEEYRQSRLLLARSAAGLSAAVLAVAAAQTMGWLTVSVSFLVNFAGLALFTIVVGMFGWMLLGGDWTPEERKRLAVIFVLFCASALFWSAFEQAGSSLNLFAQRNTDTRLWGFDFPASWFQSLNAMFIIVLAAGFAWLWLRLGARQPSSPAKFALGLLLVGLGFVVMMLAAARAAGGQLVSPLWLVATYLLHTMGELCLSPVGLSAMTKLAPARVAGLMMGVWFVSLSAGNYLGGRLAAFYGDLPAGELFRTIAIFAISAALVLGLISRPVSRLAGERN